MAFVIDASPAARGLRVSRTAHAAFVLDALEQALHERRPVQGGGLVHHSDRGVQYVSIRYTERLADAGIEPSVGSIGDSYDNALAETINGLYKTEVIRRRGPWRSLETVEFATLEWVEWFNNRRLLEPIGNIPPAEAEARYYQQIETLPMAASLKKISLRQTRRGSKQECQSPQSGIWAGRAGLGWVTMSERDLQRVQVLGEVTNRRRTIASAAAVLALSTRQMHRLLKAHRLGGAGAIAHKARGRPSNNRLADELRDQAVQLVRSAYADFGPTLAAEMLAQKHGLKVSRETLRGWMIETGLWLSRQQRRRLHQPRLRREALGELVQIDGSEHRWFEDRAEPCTLLVFIDDATGRLMQLRFVPSESAFTYFEALKGYLETHGCPIAFYSDRHSIFRVPRKDAKGGQGMTQFGRALAELNIEILCASSSQAKGRVERVNRTLQDRLVKELRMAGVSSIEAGNAFLPGFIARFNARFAVAPARPNDLHRPLNIPPERLRMILCRREQRYVGQQLTLSYDRLA